MAFVYVYRSGDRNAFKIGRAADLERRKKALVTGNPEPLIEFDVIDTEHASQCETYLHHRLRSKRVSRSGGNEWFEVDPDELAEIVEDARNYVEEVLPLVAEAERLGEAECDARVLEPTTSDWEIYLELVRVREAYETLEFDLQRLEAQLKIAIGTASGIARMANWKVVSSRRFDQDAFARAHPELHAVFLRDTRSRRFTLL